MTVTELRRVLKYVPGKTEVILSCDEEGNRFYKTGGIQYVQNITADEMLLTSNPKESKMFLIWPTHEEV